MSHGRERVTTKHRGGRGRGRGRTRIGTALVVTTLAGGVSAAMAGRPGAAQAAARPADTIVPALVGDVVGTLVWLGADAPTTSTTTTTTTTIRVRASPEPSPAPGPAPAPSGPPHPRCAEGRRAVEAAGLYLPPQFEYRCPGNTQLFVGDRQHWGTACHYASLCPGGAYIAINPGVIGTSDARLRYVIAHEMCHAIDADAGRPMTEGPADACAASHGFGRT